MPSRQLCGITACAIAEVSRRHRLSSDDIRILAGRALADDPAAVQMFDEFGMRLADGVATLLAAYRPQILIIGGSASAYFTQYRESLQRVLGSITGTFPLPRISAAEFGEYGGAIGAAALARAKSSSVN